MRLVRFATVPAMHGDNKIFEIAADTSETGIRHDAQLPPNCRVETARQSACGTSFALKQPSQRLLRIQNQRQRALHAYCT
jgi:hypothetical protein